MILAALAIGLVGRLDASTLVASFNSGYGAALGEFALILIPSFVLAACLSHRSAGSAAGAATVASPFMAAGMICPDTSYAALAPVAGHRKLSVALAGYAGFKLLFPAGPLIVATGLGVDSPYLFVVGLILLGPAWLFSELWVRYRTRLRAVSFVEQGIATGSMVRALMPFGGMALLLVIGSVADLSAWSFLDFVTQPKGALAVAATAALLDTEAHRRPWRGQKGQGRQPTDPLLPTKLARPPCGLAVADETSCRPTAEGTVSGLKNTFSKIKDCRMLHVS